MFLAIGTWGMFKVLFNINRMAAHKNSTRTYYIAHGTQCYVPTWMGGGLGEEWIHVYGWLSPFAVHLKLP